MCFWQAGGPGLVLPAKQAPLGSQMPSSSPAAAPQQAVGASPPVHLAESSCLQVVELVAEEAAPRLSYLELLQGHPSDISQADKAAAAEAREQAAAAAEAARSEVRKYVVCCLGLGTAGRLQAQDVGLVVPCGPSRT